MWIKAELKGEGIDEGDSDDEKKEEDDPELKGLNVNTRLICYCQPPSFFFFFSFLKVYQHIRP
jgi:hypothetical protein